MSNLSVKKRNISSVLKIIVILSALIGTFMSVYADRHSFMGGLRMFMYFTIQSNIAIAAICGRGLYLILKGKDVSMTWYIIKFVGTVSITLTGVVFGLVLAPTLGPNAWVARNVLTHLVVPLAAVLDFFVVAPKARIQRKNVIFVIIPPLLYALYAGIGYVSGWEFSDGINYPYFFLNWGSPAGAFGFTGELPFMGTFWWIVLLFMFLIGVGHCYLALADLLDKKCKCS